MEKLVIKYQQHFFFFSLGASDWYKELGALKMNDSCVLRGLVSALNYGDVLYILYIASAALWNP